MTKIEGGWEVKEAVGLDSEAKIVLDQLDNVWYRGDVDVVLGKKTESGKFLPTPNRDVSAKLLRMIANIIEKE
jgi:hypothetical protein